MASNIPNIDEKIALVIGDLLSKANSTAKAILTAFDTSKDIPVNCKALSGPRFSKSDLTACAQFLQIKTEDQEGRPIFSNKPSLANRIILEIQSFYPAICAACDAEYSVKFDIESKPTMRCFLCFQGCHDCETFKSQPTDSLTSSPHGTVWLCRSCHEANNPIKPPRSKSRDSKTPSRSQSGTNTPARPDESKNKVSFSKSELFERLEDLQNRQDTNPHHSTPHSNSNNRNGDICELFKVGKCPHGVSGKTAANNEPFCSKVHPKRCTKFTRYGKNNRYGCRRGDKCRFFHPQHCPTSLSDKCCYSEKCTLVHIVGTKRRKPPSRDSYRRLDNDSDRSRVRSNSNTQGSRSRTTSENRSTVNSHQEQPTSADFLEIRSLLMEFQDTFQKEIAGLKSNILEQDNKMSSILPPLSHHVMRHYLPVPLHPSQLPLQPQSSNQTLQPQQFLHSQRHPLPPQQMTWQNIQASGC